MNRHGELVIVDDTGRERERYGLRVRRDAHGQGRRARSRPGQLLAEWDPFAMPILTEVGGVVKFGDIIEGVTMQEKLDEVTGLSRKVDHRVASDPDARPRITLKDPRPARPSSCRAATLEARYFLPVGANIVVNDGDHIEAGDVIAKIPRETTKTKDITGGLPRVAELFEARKPKDHAVIARDRRRGHVRQGHQGQAQGGHHARASASRREYLIPKGKHICGAARATASAPASR